MEKYDLYTINNTINKTIRNMDQESTNNGPSLRDTNQDPLSVNSGPSSRNISSNNGPIFISSTNRKKKSTSGKTHNSKIRKQDKKILVKPNSKKKRHTVDVSTNYGPSSRGPIPFQNDDMFSNLFQNSDMFSNDGPSSKDPYYDPFFLSSNRLLQAETINFLKDQQEESKNLEQRLMTIFIELQKNQETDFDINTSGEKSDSSPIGDDGIEILKNYILDTKRHITSIELPNNKITDIGVGRLVASLRNQVNFIREVNLRNNNFSDRGVKVLATFLKDAHFLRKLDLKGNPIEIDGIKSLLELAKANISLLDLKFHVENDILPKEEDDECMICYETFTFTDTDLVMVLCCGKFFHRECLGIWRDRSMTCPACRQKTTFKKVGRNIDSSLTSVFDTSKRKFLALFPRLPAIYESKHGIENNEKQNKLNELFVQIKFNVDFQQFYRKKRNIHNSEHTPTKDEIIEFYLNEQRDRPKILNRELTEKEKKEEDLMSKLKQWIEAKEKRSISDIDVARRKIRMENIIKEYFIPDTEENRKTILNSLKSDDELIIVMFPTSTIHVLKVKRQTYFSLPYYNLHITKILRIFGGIDDFDRQELACNIMNGYFYQKYKIFGIDRNPNNPDKLSLIWKLKD